MNPKILLTALACWASGIVAVILTADSSLIATIFPPAGIGIAAVLVLGPRALVGVFVGILAMTLSLEAVTAAGTGIALATGVVAGLVGAGQAALGAALVRKLLPAGAPPPSEPRRIVALLLLAGPASSLACAVAGTALLFAGGHLPLDRVTEAGYRLWVADTLGVTIFLPITLALTALPRAQWRPLALTAGLPMLLAGLLVATALTRQELADHETAQHAFTSKSAEATRGFQDRLEEVQLILDAVHGHVVASRGIGRDDFRRFTAPLLDRAPAIQALGVAEHVRPGERDDFLQRQHEIHGSGFRLLARDDGNHLVPAPSNADAMVISLVEPWQENRRALGVDALHTPAGAAIRGALRAGEQTATGGFELTLRPGGGLGAVIYKSLSQADAPARGIGAAEPIHPGGVAFVALRFDPLAAASFEGLGPGFVHCVLDITDARPMALTGNGACPDDGARPATGFSRPVQWRGEIPMAGRTLELRFETAEAGAATAVATTRGVAVFGALTLAAFLLSMAGRSAEVTRLVERRTHELAEEMKIRRRITGALARSEQRLRTLLGNTPAGIVEMTPDQRIAQANSHFYGLVGVREPALVGRRVLELVHPDERDAESGAWSSLAAQGVDQIQRRFRLLRDDGSAISVDAVSSPIRDARGRVVRIVAVIQDLSEIEQRAIAEMAREKAEAASRAKTEFVARMSHELRTPLNALLGFAQLLASRPEEPLSDQQAEAVRVIEQSGWHLLDMINDLLELSRIEAGHVRVQLGRIDLEVIVAESLHLVGALGQPQSILVSTHVDEAARHVIADPTRLRQVLVNLLSNAIKYNRPHGRVRIEAQREAGSSRIALRVRDTGAGMNAEQLAHLFEPFNRLGRDDTIPGTGIGLAIARNLVELMDGTLEAGSLPGQGSCFTVRLAAAQPPGVEPTARPIGRATAH